MAKNIPAALLLEKNKLSTDDPWLLLVELNLGGNIIRITNNNEDVTFASATYTSFPFTLEPSSETTEGQLPVASITLGNASRTLQYYIESLNGAVGSTVKVIVVNAAHLGEDYSELELTLTVLSAKADEAWLTLSLGAENILRKRFPLYRYISNNCNWIFKEVECAYAGADTTCKRTYADCLAKGNLARFGGYKGISEKGYKFA